MTPSMGDLIRETGEILSLIEIQYREYVAACRRYCGIRITHLILLVYSLFSSLTLLGQVLPWEYLLLSRFKAQASIIKEKRYHHIYNF